jgi:4'-phosphopantetheinyl transferase
MPGLAPHEVRLWAQATDALDDQALDRAVAVLSPAERARHGRFHFAHHRRDYAIAHALVRTSLSRCGTLSPAAWTFEEHASGRPLVTSQPGTPPPPSFSLSHTHGFVACAIASAADIGVDVERVDRKVEQAAIAARYYAPGELAQLARCAPERRAARFFELWTLKEAYLKAIGAGLSHSLSAVAFDLDDGGGIALVKPTAAESSDWQFALFEPAPTYRLAVAIRHARAEPRQIAATLVVPGGEAAIAPIRTSRG